MALVLATYLFVFAFGYGVAWLIYAPAPRRRPDDRPFTRRFP